MDYSTLQAWEDDLPANIVSLDERHIGECYDQGTFTGRCSFSGCTTDATRSVILRCATGASFKDKAGVRTTPLFYDNTNGVSVENNGSSGQVLEVFDIANVLIDGLQVNVTSFPWAVKFFGGSKPSAMRDCILTSGGNFASGVLADDSYNDATVVLYVNCLFIWPDAGNVCVQLSAKMVNCTVVCTATSTSAEAIKLPSNIGVIQNTAVFGFTTFSSGTPASGSDFNATDLSSAITGSNNQVSLTFADQFEDVATDFRALASGDLQAGNPDATNAPLDISQFDRDDTTPYIGCWEASAPATSFTVSPTTIPEDHAGDITLTLTGSGTTWASGSTVTITNDLTGNTDVIEGTWNRISDTSATLEVTTGAGTGTYRITIDGVDNSGTLTVATPTLSVSPDTGIVSDTHAVTLTGTNTVWTQEVEATLFTIAGVSGTTIGTIDVVSDTSATADIDTGATTGTATITDESVGTTDTFEVTSTSGTITITSPVQYQTFQRDGSDEADIEIAGTYTGGPATKEIEASFNGGAYATIDTGAGGNFSGTLTGQAAGQGTLTVRFVNETGLLNTVADVGIGDVFLVAGQSNAVGLLDAQNNYSHATLKAAAFTDHAGTGAEWIEGNDPWVSSINLGSIWPLLATRHMADQSVPAAFIQAAAGGTSLRDGSTNQWYWSKRRPDTGAAGTGYANAITRVTDSGVNGVKAVLWIQGENDIDNDVERWSYVAGLLELANNFATDIPGAPKLVPLQIGYNGGGSGDWEGVRLAFTDAVSPDILAVPTNYDIGPSGSLDGGNALHITGATAAANVANRFWAALDQGLYSGPTGEGPRVVGCQHNADRDEITVEFDQVLKTGLTFATSVWAVTGNGVSATVSGVAYHATNTRAVVLTLSAAAALPILVSFALGSATAGIVVPLGPDITIPAGGTVNLPAYPFKDQQAASAEISEGSGGGGGGMFGGVVIR